MADTQDFARLTDLWMPEWRCLPSHVAVADMASLEPAVASVPERLPPDAVPRQLAFRFGIDLFNAGFFWEAHEVWEPVWMALPPNSRERIALKALIQAANACLKLRYGSRGAFGKLASEIERLVRDITVRDHFVAGLDLAEWQVSFAAFGARIQDGDAAVFGFRPSGTEGFPFIEMEGASVR